MYQHDIKNDFIEYAKQNNKSLDYVFVNLFDNTAKMEIPMEKDICDFSSYELIQFFKLLSTSSFTRLLNVHSMLNRYTDWCISKKISNTGINHLYEIDKYVLHDCINKGKANKEVVTRDNILEDIGMFANVSECFLVLAVFEGLSGSGYQRLKHLFPEDFENNKVHLTDRKGNEFVFDVSNEVEDYALASSEEYTYYGYSSDGSIIVNKYGYDRNDRRVLKDLNNCYSAESNDLAFQRRATRRLLNIQKYIGSPAYSFEALLISGKIDRINQIIAERNISIKDAITVFNKEFCPRYSKIQNVSVFIDRYNPFFVDRMQTQNL